MTGIDGIRQDTWPYVPRSFWRDWMKAIKREYPAMRVVGEVFGMNRYDRRAAIVNRGRVVTITLPARYRFLSSVQVVGWAVPAQNYGQR